MFFSNADKNIINSLDNIIDYLNNKTNIIVPNDFKSSRKNKEVTKRLDLIIEILNKKNDDELHIYGEIMLVAEKMMKGDFSDRIFNIKTSNIKLNYIASVINNLNYSMKTNIDNMLKVLDEYSTQLSHIKPNSF